MVNQDEYSLLIQNLGRFALSRGFALLFEPMMVGRTIVFGLWAMLAMVSAGLTSCNCFDNRMRPCIVAFCSGCYRFHAFKCIRTELACVRLLRQIFE